MLEGHAKVSDAGEEPFGGANNVLRATRDGQQGQRNGRSRRREVMREAADDCHIVGLFAANNNRALAIKLKRQLQIIAISFGSSPVAI